MSSLFTIDENGLHLGSLLLTYITDDDFEGAEFSADSAAEVVFYSEIPVDKDTFNTMGADYKKAISELSDGAPVMVTNIETVKAGTFTRMVM